MIHIGMGGNLRSAYGHPYQTMMACRKILPSYGIRVVAMSPFYVNPPMGKKEQQAYVNAVMRVESRFLPHVLLKRLHDIEAIFERERRIYWESRTLDLDLLDWHGHIMYGNLTIPHYGLHHRAFVLIPLRDVTPHWRHPISGRSVQFLIRSMTDKDLINMCKIKYIIA